MIEKNEGKIWLKEMKQIQWKDWNKKSNNKNKKKKNQFFT